MKGCLRSRLSLIGVMVALSSCSSGAVHPPQSPRRGPSRVQLDLVQEHARWFDSKDPDRPAGSQQELVASSYLLAHLERAGYLVKLDPVPVGNLLHSTNVIALAPSGFATTVVIVDYDTAVTSPSDGTAIGTFLELARALRAMHPRHSVEFAALGAEDVAFAGGDVGARSLIKQLQEQSARPQIIRLAAIQPGSRAMSVAGPAATAIRAVTSGQVHVEATEAVPPDSFTQAGFRETVVSGGVSGSADLLTYLDWLNKKQSDR